MPKRERPNLQKLLTTPETYQLKRARGKYKLQLIINEREVDSSEWLEHNIKDLMKPLEDPVSSNTDGGEDDKGLIARLMDNTANVNDDCYVLPSLEFIQALCENFSKNENKYFQQYLLCSKEDIKTSLELLEGTHLLKCYWYCVLNKKKNNQFHTYTYTYDQFQEYMNNFIKRLNRIEPTQKVSKGVEDSELTSQNSVFQNTAIYFAAKEAYAYEELPEKMSNVAQNLQTITTQIKQLIKRRDEVKKEPKLDTSGAVKHLESGIANELKYALSVRAQGRQLCGQANALFEQADKKNVKRLKV